ncbi:MAG: transcription termination/antitermination protein NusG [Bacteroidales bacterium]|jgi:transcriptional antiterminator NusG|nr:transcription termination/antitermination protein NusG [Bacteroidales bacterium]MDD3724700.1 transcription termination/antitermination protein NusG [Bacteroidales bacterium]MDD4544496.1 transcription termination/antitermination protein NusG [Bacteroidales bacterium]MDY0053061.1 transcription termination/antitermination protein NusG [Bacteroidales bacterium]
MSEQSMKWYVLRAIAGKEKKAKEYLENEIARLGLQNNISQVLIPTEKVYSVRNGKRVSKERNIFPGYVLVEANLEGEIAHIIKSVTHIIDFLSEKNGAPVPIQEHEVNRILGQVDEMVGQKQEFSDPFIIGESVKIVDGPFSNFSATVEEINDEKKKLKVTVKIFGRRTPVELSYVQVEKE